MTAMSQSVGHAGRDVHCNKAFAVKAPLANWVGSANQRWNASKSAAITRSKSAPGSGRALALDGSRMALARAHRSSRAWLNSGCSRRVRFRTSLRATTQSAQASAGNPDFIVTWARTSFTLENARLQHSSSACARHIFSWCSNCSSTSRDCSASAALFDLPCQIKVVTTEPTVAAAPIPASSHVTTGTVPVPRMLQRRCLTRQANGNTV
jgi:hypothetical protein